MAERDKVGVNTGKEAMRRAEETRRARENDFNQGQPCEKEATARPSLAERIKARTNSAREDVLNNSSYVLKLERLEYLLSKHKEVGELLELWSEVVKFGNSL